MSVLGGVFLLVGLGMVQIAFQRVEQNKGVSVNGRNPFRLVSQWQNPQTAETQMFRSKNLWFDPTDYVNDSSILVFVDNKNPRKYAMDVSFLPRSAS